MPQVITKPVSFCKLITSQVERHSGTESHKRLTESIRQHGILQPPGARIDGTVVWGTGRVMAAREIGLPEIQLVLLEKPMTEAEYRVLTLTENFVRTDLKPVEQVDGIDELVKLNPDLSNQAIANLLSLDASMVTRLRAVANCKVARSALAEGKLTGLSEAYVVAKAEASQKEALIALKQSGATRDQLERSRKATVATKTAAKLSRVRCPLPGGATVVVTGPEMTLEGLIETLQSALDLSKKASRESLDVKTAERVWKDRAKAAASTPPTAGM